MRKQNALKKPELLFWLEFRNGSEEWRGVNRNQNLWDLVCDEKVYKKHLGNVEHF